MNTINTTQNNTVGLSFTCGECGIFTLGAYKTQGRSNICLRCSNMEKAKANKKKRNGF